MATRGTIAKQEVFAKIMQVYPNAFWEDENKVLRIPVEENGNLVEIKVSLTAAKNILGDGEVPSAFKLVNAPASPKTKAAPAFEEKRPELEMTEAEMTNVANLMSALGL